MRKSILVLLSVGLVTVSCRAPQGVVEKLVPERANWLARTPRHESVQTYALTLDNLNPGAHGPFDVSDGVTLDEAESVALLFNPDLRVVRLEARVPLVGAQQSGVPDDPRLQLDALRVLQSISNPWVLATGLGFTIPLSGRLAAERVRAFAEADAALRAALVREWAIVIKLREAWNDWSAVQERATLLQAHIAQLEGIVQIARKQREAGQLGVTDLRILELEQVSRAGDLMVLRAELVRRSIDLKALMGLAPSAEFEFVPGFAGDVRDLSWQAEVARLERTNLELALAQAEFAAADRALRHEVSSRFPDIEVGPLFESEEGVEKLGAGIGLPVPLWNRNRRAIGEACARRAAAQVAYQARYEVLVSDLARARADYDTATARRTWLAERVAPMADEQLADVQRLGELGDMDVLILKDALSSVLEAKLDLLAARLEQAAASNRRRALTEPLSTPTSHEWK